ncbi:hypothetical protein BX264_2511 [Streptomyces sp. 2333.5]|uniref:hypothetical protein n=1 Tax=Streptomyces TaxID=1883 RepID=UPI0008945B08|nr:MULTISPECIES: hypothetical protein [unclassified Streptomyces]PJJ02177.1 hypothetical protein BX264_2511 [Streptomyces sp. 2333.5]SEC98895.1 hypothetical protein SAMN05428943_2649 [Streptomyces sp. 2314.4]SED84922.1 hypothetical protein SAMN05428942_2613 [Streptomyces sp. 2112.2]
MSDLLRLLPWSGADGQPCYVSADSDGGPVSRLADRLEELQLDTAAELLDHIEELLRAHRVSADELRFCVHRLVEALRDALRVAESRGRRIPGAGDDMEGHPEPPDLC